MEEAHWRRPVAQSGGVTAAGGDVGSKWGTRCLFDQPKSFTELSYCSSSRKMVTRGSGESWRQRPSVAMTDGGGGSRCTGHREEERPVQ
jgi:hypothetical protein